MMWMGAARRDLAAPCTHDSRHHLYWHAFPCPFVLPPRSQGRTTPAECPGRHADLLLLCITAPFSIALQ